MESPIYIALSRQAAMKRDLDVIANNVANASTTGYRGERTIFQEYLQRTGTAFGKREVMSFTQDIGQFRDIQDGPLNVTNNDFDLALRGSGYFAVGNPGQELYARTGMFHLDSQRQMLTSEGYPILGENGQPITVPQNVATVKINGDGVVMSDKNEEIGRLRLVRFENEQIMRKAGVGLYATDQEPQPGTGVQVVQGALEGSNISSIIEIGRMLQMIRDYEATQKMVDGEHERQRNAIVKLTRV